MLVIMSFSTLKSSLRSPSNFDLYNLPTTFEDNVRYSFNRNGTPCINCSDDFSYAVRMNEHNFTYAFVRHQDAVQIYIEP